MEMSSKQDPGADSGVTAFLQGALRKELGLEAIDLKAGLAIAKNHLSRGATVEAMRTYVALVLCEPMNVDFQVGLANCALLIEEYPLALQAASAVVALAPRDPRGYLLSGRACLGMGQLAEAAEDLRDAVEHGRNARDAAIVNEASGLLQKISRMQS
jgi:hypothetical protein